ncbi:hypothetical protein ANTPLA_LOCUS2944 [Anthophora plagiata]
MASASVDDKMAAVYIRRQPLWTKQWLHIYGVSRCDAPSDCRIYTAAVAKGLNIVLSEEFHLSSLNCLLYLPQNIPKASQYDLHASQLLHSGTKR